MNATVRLVAAACLFAPALASQQPQQPPTPAQLATREANRLDSEGKTTAARAIFQRLIDSAATPAARAAAQRSMAMSYAFDGDCNNAIRLERMVIDYWRTREQAEPQNAFYQQGEMANEAARVCIDAGALDSAETYYRLGSELGNKEPEPRTHPKSLWDYRLAHALGRIAARRGNKAEAERQVQLARRALDSDTAMARQQERFYPYLQGYVAMFTDDLAAAEQYLTKAVAMEGNDRDPFMHYLLARTYEWQGKAYEAHDWYQRAYALATGHNPPNAFTRPAARRRLGAILDYDRRNVMITMRDGVKLNTEIFVPKNAAGPLPILFRRTPYSVSPFSIIAVEPNRPLHELAQDGYIFAFQDIRGRYKSEGQFVMQRAPRSGAERIDEGTDAYDTIDWLIKNVPNNNGRVGIYGVSYDGWTSAMALLEPHPALRAASPQASPADMFLGDDFHHNGAFRLSYGFEYATMMETNKESAPFQFDRYDTYDWYLQLGALSNVNTKYLKGKIPTWNDFVAHPNYDAFWQRQAMVTHIKKPSNVPTLNVAGWWDQEDFYGPITIYLEREKYDTAKVNFLVVGPWRHGSWNAADGTRLGNIDFGSNTSKYYREKIQAPFFAYYLKGKGDLRQPEAITFAAGANEWRTWDSWPPKQGVASRMLYFHPNGKLSFDRPAVIPSAAAVIPSAGAVIPSAGAVIPSAGAVIPSAARDLQVDSYISDPKHPVPYRKRPIEWTYDSRGSGWGVWLTEDQRFVHNRPDVLSYETEPLAEDVEIAGDVLADLKIATSGSDLDLIVKLIDVYPDSMADAKMGGYQFMVSNEVFRGRFRESFERPRAITPNVVTPFKYSLRTQSYRFKKGHRIMVQVQSTWFPLIDRNPQKFVPNIFEAKESDFQSATVRVSRSPSQASGVVIPVVTRVIP